MAAVQRRYTFVGPSVDQLQTFMATSALIVTSYDGPVIVISVDDGVPGHISNADAYMLELGWIPDATAQPVATFATLVQAFLIGARASYASSSPLGVGIISFNPTLYAMANMSVAFQFIAVAANGTTPLTSHARLFNITDGEVVTSSVLNIVDQTNQTKFSAVLTVGNSANQFKQSEKLYEAQIFVDSPGDENDTIELSRAEISVVFTAL